MHTACIQKLSLKTSRQDFWNFVMSQQSSHCSQPCPDPRPPGPTIQPCRIWFLCVYLKSAVVLLDHSENSQPIRREAENLFVFGMIIFICIFIILTIKRQVEDRHVHFHIDVLLPVNIVRLEE